MSDQPILVGEEFDPTLTQAATKRAQDASVWHTFGRLSVASTYYRWPQPFGSGERPVQIARADYEKDPKGAFQEIVFGVDSAEFNEKQTQPYSRKVRVEAKIKVEDDSGKKRRIDSDWIATVQPSLNQVFGSLPGLAAALKDKAGCYVEVIDVPQAGDADFNTVKFVRKFATLADCIHAWEERQGGAAAAATDESAIPATVIASAKTIWEALGKDNGRFVKNAAKDATLKQYDATDLLVAIGAITKEGLPY